MSSRTDSPSNPRQSGVAAHNGHGTCSWLDSELHGLRQALERVHLVVENLPLGYQAMDGEGRIIAVNRTWQAIAGYTLEEVLGRRFGELLDSADAERFATSFMAAKVTGEIRGLELRMRRKDGQTVDVELNGRVGPEAAGPSEGTQVFVKDITARVEGVRKLQESEARFRALFEQAAVGVAQIETRTGQFLRINRRYCDVVGYTRKEMEELTFQAITHPDDLGEDLRNMERLVAGTSREFSLEKRYYHKNGSVVWVNLTVSPMWAPGQEPDYHIAVVEDITERKRAEVAERQERDRAQRYLDIAGVMLVVLNERGEVSLINRKGCQMLGSQEGDILGRNWFDHYVPEEDRARVKAAFELLMAGEIEPIEQFENCVLDCRGERRIIAWNNTVLRDLDGTITGTLSSGEDITERRKAEEERRRLEDQVRHTQKLESLGVLAGGIAHDFNNLLMAILGNTELAIRVLPPDSRARTFLAEVEKGSLRAADLCKQMLAYSGRGSFETEVVDLSAVVEEMSHMLEISISKKATLRYCFARDLPPIVVDVTQIRQVVMNLITNASEALGEENGVIEISTQHRDCERNDLVDGYLDDNLPAGRYVVLTVSDTGCGMDPATRSKLFDPFFTTKFTGRGLGLAAVLGIVRGHKGAIRIDSELGRGTSFTVFFPAAPPAIPATATEVPRQVTGWQGSGMVLLVDDDDAVRSLAQHMLQKAGFTVLTAANGREGVEAFRKHRTDIACVLLDQTMPVMNGQEALRELRRLDGGVPVVLMSGYDEQDVMQSFAEQPPAGFLQKPFQQEALSRMMRNVLGS